MNLLKTHPVSLVENLRQICDVLGLDMSQKKIKVMMQTEIDNFLIKEPDLEPNVREIVNQITTYRNVFPFSLSAI